MTSHRIGVNLRVSGNCDQGARKYMEDNHVIKFLKKDTDDYEFAYFGIFDGHGGHEASAFCRDNLLNEITKYEGFWTNNDDQVLSAIRKGFIDTHTAMWTVLDTWPKTMTGLPSTSGSTATIAIVKQGKLYSGHVGDSGLVLGENDIYSGDKFPVQAICLTKDHKPDDPQERSRIEDAGGEVINKSGVPRVVWSRPKTSHKGPIRRSTQIDQIPFLAVARSLGDLWSYDYYSKTYIVSPEPDVSVVPLDSSKHRCLILASDGLWNMLTPEESVNMVIDLEAQFEQRIISDPTVSVTFWSNPAERLVARALNKWRSKALKADNTSCVVVLIDPLGPSKLTLLKRKRQELLSGGEIINPQFHKLPPPPLPLEVDYRNKSSNQNANCSISDSHIRVTDESMIRAPSRDALLQQYPVPSSGVDDESDPYYSLRRLVDDYEGRMGETGQVTSMLKALKEAMKKPEGGESHASDDLHTLRHGTYPVRRDGQSRSENFHGSVESFTGIKSTSGLAANSCHKVAGPARVADGKRKRCESILEDSGEMEEEEVDVGNNDAKMDAYDVEIPVPPPCTPYSDKEDMDVENEVGDDTSLHSSANATDIAFTLASDESLGSPEPSVRPPSPSSAPAKLTSAGHRRSRKSSTAKKQLLMSTLNKPNKTVKSSVAKASAASHKQPPQNPPSSHKAALPPPMPKTAGHGKKLSSVSSPNDNHHKKGGRAKNPADAGLPVDVVGSPPKRVLSTSHSMNDVITPKTYRNAGCRSVSCSGLTPDMDMLVVQKEKKINLATTLDRSMTRQLISSIMAEDKQNFSKAAALMRSGNGRDSSMIVEDPELPLPSATTNLPAADTLRQLNKTGPLRKTGSKRFSSFLRASKLGLDNVFRKNKPSSASTGRLEVKEPGSQSTAAATRNTSMSTSKLTDLMQQTRLPDVTISHYGDVTLDASTLTAGDLTNLSALSAEDSMISAAAFDKGHHSMLEEGVRGKKAKHRKGFLQKTRFTLRRAKRAAKKAFLPENHGPAAGAGQRAPGTKRKSDEFLPTPELKRRKQLLGVD